MRPQPPRPPLFPYTTLFRSARAGREAGVVVRDSSHPCGCAESDPQALAGVAAAVAVCVPLVGIGHEGTIVQERRDRKSTRLNSSHVAISYAVFCLKKKKKKT